MQYIFIVRRKVCIDGRFFLNVEINLTLYIYVQRTIMINESEKKVTSISQKIYIGKKRREDGLNLGV